jgi:hypothetical protein
MNRCRTPASGSGALIVSMSLIATVPSMLKVGQNARDQRFRLDARAELRWSLR